MKDCSGEDGDHLSILQSRIRISLCGGKEIQESPTERAPDRSASGSCLCSPAVGPPKSRLMRNGSCGSQPLEAFFSLMTLRFAVRR